MKVFNILSVEKVSIVHLFSQRKCDIKFLLRQLMASKTLRFIFHHPLKQWPTGKKKAEVEKKNFENGKLHSYLRAITS